jgi:hypothetical protein
MTSPLPVCRFVAAMFVLLHIATAEAAQPDAAIASVVAPKNAAKNVKYIGSERCDTCHKDQHASFLRTLHSKAAQLTDVTSEPMPNRFDHLPSGNTYEVAVVNDQLVHRELLRSAAR